nr:hypothetical protein [Tanacetum cinerariifolium]
MGSLALLEANAVNNNDNKNSGSKRGRGNPRGHDRGRGHYGHNHFPNRNYTYHRGGYNGCGRSHGHSGSTMIKRIVKNTHGHPLIDQKFPKIDKVPLCTSYSLEKLIARPSPLKVENESPMFFERIQVEKNNELLMKYHQTRPMGSLALLEANAVNNNDNKNSGSKRGRGNPRGHDRGRGHYGHNHFPNRNYTYHRGDYNGCGRSHGQRNNTYHAPQVNNLNHQNNEVGTSQNPKGSRFRCGSANHWSKSCRTPSHL